MSARTGVKKVARFTSKIVNKLADGVADTYVREIKETSAIMEDRAGPK